jgi:hypothetical protein
LFSLLIPFVVNVFPEQIFTYKLVYTEQRYLFYIVTASLSLCLSLCLPACLSLCLFVRLSVNMSVCLPVCLPSMVLLVCKILLNLPQSIFPWQSLIFTLIEMRVNRVSYKHRTNASKRFTSVINSVS